MKNRNAFTLVELLVVLVIFVIVVALTLAAVGIFDLNDTSAEAGNQIAAGCKRAKAQAEKDRERRGIRLLLIPGKRYVTSFVPIGGPESFNQLTLAKESRGFVYKGDYLTQALIDEAQNPGPNTQDKIDAALDAYWLAVGNAPRTPNPNAAPILATTSPGASFTSLSQLTPIWSQLESSGALDSAGSQLMVSGQLYHLRKISGQWRTTRPIASPHSNALIDYIVHGLHPTILPNAEPRELPKGSVIDLANSIIPASWTLHDGSHSTTMDIVFDERGERVGPLLPGGNTIMMLVTNIADLGKLPGDPTKERPETIVAIFRRGIITTTAVDDTDANGNGIADDPFNFAHLGTGEKR